MRCAYCNVSEWNANPARGEPWDAARMARRVAARRREGAETLVKSGFHSVEGLMAVDADDLKEILGEEKAIAVHNAVMATQAAAEGEAPAQ